MLAEIQMPQHRGLEPLQMASGYLTWQLSCKGRNKSPVGPGSDLSTLRCLSCTGRPMAWGTCTTFPGVSVLRGEGWRRAGGLESGLSKSRGQAVQKPVFLNPISLRLTHSCLPALVCSTAREQPLWEQSLDDCIRRQYSLRPQPTAPVPSHYQLKHRQQPSFTATSRLRWTISTQSLVPAMPCRRRMCSTSCYSMGPVLLLATRT